MFPSSVLVDTFRGISGTAGGGLGAFLGWLGEPASSAPADEQSCLSTAEWWLWRLTGGEEVPSSGGVVENAYPHLGRGRQAQEARAGKRFTAWDGCVPRAGRDLNPLRPGGMVLSANRLETAAACPLRFFFRYALMVTPPDRRMPAPGRWLDALSRGSLLHELFERTMRPVMDRKGCPRYEIDYEHMASILEQLVKRYRDHTPPPGEGAFRRELRELQRIAQTFLREDELFCTARSHVPIHLEVSLGTAGGAVRSTIDSPDPLTVHLPRGGTIRVRGRIDRIDRTCRGGRGGIGIWDYKSGSSRAYDRADPHRKGRTIQPWLYTAMVMQRLGEIRSEEASVDFFGFFFPGPGPAGERIMWPLRNLSGGGEIAEEICKTIAGGAFIATTSWEEDCRRCDYRVVCGDGELLKGLSSSAARKMEHDAYPPLSSFARLRLSPEHRGVRAVDGS